jgi:DNA-binding CsgD family transcriptional regulator
MPPQTDGVLEALGLDPEVERLYLAVLELPALPLPELATRVGMTTARARTAMERLESLGLVSRAAGQPVRWTPISPAVALETLALQRERAIEVARQTAQALQRRFGHRERDASDLIEILTTRETIAQRYVQIQHSATEEILNFDTPPYSLEPDDIGTELERLAAGIRYRVVYTHEALRVQGRFTTLQHLIAAGQEARALASLPMKLVVADRRLALMPLQIDTSHALASAIVVHASSLLELLALVFEEHWGRATPVQDTERAAANGHGGLEPVERRILAMLASGLKDETVARQLGVTERTVRRHVHAILERLDASTRMQAALRARDRGWL